MRFEKLSTNDLRWFCDVGRGSHSHRSQIRLNLRNEFRQHGISAEITISPSINVEFSSPADEALFIILYSDSI